MIYELAILAKDSIGDQGAKALEKLVRETIAEYKGETLMFDDWGTKVLAQSTLKGASRGHYLFFMYRSSTELNAELTRKLGIQETTIRNLIVKLADDRKGAELLKKYKTPFSKTHRGSAIDILEEEGEGMGGRRFARRRSCWYEANKIIADWKDPGTYAWLVNEFGKISPGRVSGVSRKHQLKANAAIKRARNLCLVSHVSNAVAE